MGLVKRFVISKEPDMKRTVKKLVTVQAPCAAEMAALMECFRRHASGQADSSCAQHRMALDMCAKSTKKPNVSQVKSRFYAELERLGNAMRRSGF